MFYDVFSEMCLKNGVSKNKAAQEIGLSNSIVTRWKKTGSTPNGVTMAKIANYFGVSVDSLLGLESEPKEEAKVPESSNVQNTNTSPVTRTIKRNPTAAMVVGFFFALQWVSAFMRT